MKLLIVDDEALCRSGMAQIVARHRPDVEVLTACNGIEAAAILDREPVDGMFLDIRMPKCDGFELMRIMKQRGQDDIVTVIVSGLDDFEYARNAIKVNVFEYMLKPITPRETLGMLERICRESDRRRRRAMELAALRDLVAKNRGELLQFFGDVISGMYDREELIRRGELLQVDLSGGEFLCAAIKVRNRSDRSPAEKQIDTLKCRELLERFLTDWPGAELFQTNMDLFVILLTGREKGTLRPAALIDGLERLLRQAKDERGLEMAAGVAEPCHAPEHIAVCYEEAMRALRYKALFSGEETGFIRDYRSSGRGYYIADPGRFNVMLHNGEIEAVKKSVRETLNEAAARKQTGDIDSLTLACNEVLLNVCKIPNEGGVDISEHFQSGSLGLRLPDSLSKLEEIENWFDELLEVSAGQLKKQSLQNDSHLVGRVRQYVNTHYAQPINIALIAEEFGYSPNYVGRLFRDTAGVNLNDYIKDVRIARAKELLLNSTMRIADIAQETGFSDAQYFSVIFRQKEGCTPTEYRNRRP